MPASTSFRISQAAKQALAQRAAAEQVSATTLLERLIVEGVRQLDHPGIVFRGSASDRTDRRAALAAGPDVWEIISRLQELDGSEEHRIAVLVQETDLHPRQVRTALDYAAEHPDEITKRIERNHEAARASRGAAEGRRALLA
jgi:hypothetical protein